MTVHLVVNPAAGSGRASELGAQVYQALSSHRSLEHHEPASASEATELIRELAVRGVERVIVFGGDGMAHLGANALVGSETSLGLVSGGTGNDAITGLRLPTKLGPACEAAMGPARPIDLIGKESGVALTVAIVGFAVDVNERAEHMSFPKGGGRYTAAAFAELPRLSSYPLTITIDGVDHDVSPNLLAVANMASFGGGMLVAPDADPHDGLLDVVVIGPAGKGAFPPLLARVFSGRHVKSRHVKVLRGAEVRISGAAVKMRADGESWGALPTTLRALPDALLVAGI